MSGKAAPVSDFAEKQRRAPPASAIPARRPARFFGPERRAGALADSARAYRDEPAQALVEASGVGWDFSRISLQSPVREKGRAFIAGEAFGSRVPDGFAAGFAGHDAPALAPTPDPSPDPELAEDAAVNQAPKLSKSDETPATAGSCGQFSWGIRWNLDKASAKGGWIVQKLTLTRSEVHCGELKPEFHQANYWEAWQVNKGQSVTADAQRGDLRDDAYLSLKPASSNGLLSYIGEANFHEGIGDIAKYGFKVRHKPPTGDLPATTTDPGLPAGSGAIPHSITATWDCCSKGKDATTKTKILTK